MNILSKLWSACNALSAALHGLADTVNEVNDGLRHRVGLDGAGTPALEHAADAEEAPALVSNGRRSKKAVAAE